MLSGMSNGTKGLLAFMVLLFPVVMMVGSRSPNLLIWFMGVYVVLGVIGGLGVLFASKTKKKKSQEFSEEISKDANVSSTGMMNAQVQEMTDEFQRGIDIYKEYGKDLYSLPWFLMVGESGSGKTEAIRRSEIGFPDKLQNFWQGAGGTMSMHWWFSNNAVILDTAGKLFVKDSNIDSGSDTLWLDFLKMLKRNRPDCPINGLCLVIPVSSLIKKSNDEEEIASCRDLDEKAGQISRQMETLRRELGVRFPVYILITKTDQVVGFREYFKDLETPEDRFQILGWSNPAPLGEVFRPSAIRDHLKETAGRLRKKAMSMMKNPIPLSTTGKRIDDLDALYAFPNSVEQLAPKLERYLAAIFSSNQWSNEPPFLRGVYFTSALQQGAVLDQSLANALGMSMDEYERSGSEDDLSLTKNRSYFLRDLFQEKVFQEKGLIIKEGRSTKSLKGWKTIVLATAALLVLFIAILGWLTGIQKPEETKYWAHIADDIYSSQDGGFYPIYVKNSAGDWVYRTKPVDSEEIIETLDELQKLDLTKRPQMGWLLAPAAVMDGGVREGRLDAYENAVNGIVLSKLVEIAISALEEKSKSWGQSSISKADREALETLLQYSSGRKADVKKQLESLFRVADIPYSRRGKKFKKLYEPLIDSVQAAHPDGVHISEYMPKDRLAAVIDNLFSNRGGSLLPVLLKYEEIWLELNSLEPSAPYQDFVEVKDRLIACSNELRGFSPRIDDILAGEGLLESDDSESDKDVFDGDLSAPLQFGLYLIDEYEAAVEGLGDKYLESWEAIISQDEESNALKRKEELRLINQFCLDFKNEIRHVSITKLLEKTLSLSYLVEEPTKLRSVLRFSDSLKALKAKALELEQEEVFTVVLDRSVSYYTSSDYKEALAFPLIFDTKVGGVVGEDLMLNEVAALSLLAQILDENSKTASEKLESIIDVAKCLVEFTDLREGTVVPKNWELILKNDDWTAAEKVYVRPAKGQDLVWDFDSSGKAREIECYAGAEVWFSNFNKNKNLFKTGGNYKSWAAVHWALSQIGSGRPGATASIDIHQIEITVKLPDNFPTRSLDLPTSDKL